MDEATKKRQLVHVWWIWMVLKTHLGICFLAKEQKRVGERWGEGWLSMGSGCCSSFRLLAVDLALPDPFSSPTPSSAPSSSSSDEDIQDLLDAGAHVVPAPPTRGPPIPEETLWPMHLSRLPLPGAHHYSPEHSTLAYDPMRI